ncbi:MAG: bifunctional diaminohydroxyphosphoribosylaminopyrimidine deaminase/5-amino-6-(5-phosphoribosylamino)uracil reductase RibD [Clostridiales bacterium]|nr:bifunctional diaminohydroxyphosphoribosylaminopyrimidine deaminase/5-amino-6-(5-phosphoribosylamino)uracil reductase RibD [Clostridiales bacterium]
MEYDIRYMKRALELAARGMGHTSPNPMVGAVIVHDGSIIGEGYHRRCGEGHAEVNAVASVSETGKLKESTMYVTLEPCSHYGKTPPCAKLIIDTGIPRVVVGAVDPFEKVAGRGIAMLRDAGVEVVHGVLADECRQLNVKFFTAHTLRRPYVTLKWACSNDGYMDHQRGPDNKPARFSNAMTTMLTHRQRSLHDAILTTAATVNSDNPMLNVRGWSGRDPRPVILDRHGVVNPEAAILGRDPLIYRDDILLDKVLEELYSNHGITSVLVEAGPRLLQKFIDMNLWDKARVETAPWPLGDDGRHPAPGLSNGILEKCFEIGGNRLSIYINPHEH